MCTRGGEDPDKAEAWIGNTSEEKRGRSSRPAFSSARPSNISRASGLVDRLQVRANESWLGLNRRIHCLRFETNSASMYLFDRVPSLGVRREYRIALFPDGCNDPDWRRQ